MRTTLTLDADTERLIRRHMRERGVSFKAAVNDAIRNGLTGGAAPAPFVTDTASLGVPRVNLDRALQVAAELEDESLVRRSLSGS